MEELHRRERRVFPEGLNALAAAALAALVLTSTFVLRADSSADADLQYQLGTLLFEENRYDEAVDAFDRAMRSDDASLATRARKGKVRAALRIADFAVARVTAEPLGSQPDGDSIALHGDALWASGRFEEADAAYARAVEMAPDSSRAQYGRARVLASTRS